MTTRRIAYLQGAPSGHMNACLRALKDVEDVSLFITLPPTLGDAPYESDSLLADHSFELTNFSRNRALEAALREFDPHVLLIVSWHQPAYRAAAKKLTTAFRVLCMDNPWLGTLRQHLGVASSRVYIAPCFDAAFLPGERQRTFAKKLGFAESEIFDGLYSADTALFEAVHPMVDDPSGRRAFAFVGRLVPEKGVGVLADAYASYRSAVSDPWDLLVAGTGGLASQLEEIDGVHLLGFLQPRDLPGLFRRARFLVLPSSFEPWGVVVHEAATSGLGVIASDQVGAADDLVVDGQNGKIFPSGAADRMTAALLWAHQQSPAQLMRVESESRAHAGKFSPERWASTVERMANEMAGR